MEISSCFFFYLPLPYYKLIFLRKRSSIDGKTVYELWRRLFRRNHAKMRIVNFRHSWTILSIMKVCRERKSKNEYTTISKQFTPHRATAILFFFFFSIFFSIKVLFVFFFLVTITAPRWTVERREEKEIATKMIECLFFSFFRLLMAFDFLPCNFTLEAVSFGSMLIQHYEHLQIAIEIFFLKLSHVSRLCLRCDELLKTIGRN